MNTNDALRFAAIRAAETAADNRDPALAVRVARKALRDEGYEHDDYRISIRRPLTIGQLATVTIRQIPGGEPVTEEREVRR